MTASASLEALLATGPPATVRAEALELSAFLILANDNGTEALETARLRLAERRLLPVAGLDRLTIDALARTLDLAIAARTDLSKVAANVEGIERRYAAEAMQQEQRLGEAARTQRQLRAQVQALKDDVARLEAVIKNVAVGMVGGKRR